LVLVKKRLASARPMVWLPCRRILALLQLPSPGWTLGPVLVSCMACQHAQCHLQVRTRKNMPVIRPVMPDPSGASRTHPIHACNTQPDQREYLLGISLLGKRYMCTWSRANLRVNHSIGTLSSFPLLVILLDEYFISHWLLSPFLFF
jgi:hypothetical protein